MNDDQTSENSLERNQPSDARIILGPLVKYAAIGLVLVGIIVTTAVTLDRQFNKIDEEVAALQAELAQAHDQTETGIEKKNDAAAIVEQSHTADTPIAQAQPGDTIANMVEPPVVELQPATSPAEPAETGQPENTVAVGTERSEAETAVVQAAATAVESAAVIEPETVESSTAEAEVTAVQPVARDEFFDKSMDAIIAERNAYLRERDRMYLEEFRASQERQLQLMRDRLARQEQRIKEMEQRYRETYDVRAADLRETQEWRDQFFPDRI